MNDVGIVIQHEATNDLLSDDASGRGSSAPGDPGPLGHDEWMSGAENVGEI